MKTSICAAIGAEARREVAAIAAAKNIAIFLFIIIFLPFISIFCLLGVYIQNNEPACFYF